MPSGNPQNDSLVQRCIDSQPGAFNELMAQCSSSVTSTIKNIFHRYSFPAEKQDVEDLHNSVFLSLMEDDFNRLRQFRGEASFKTYINVITSRSVLDFLRKQKKYISIESESLASTLINKGPTADQQIEISDEENKIRQLINQLPASEQLLLKLVYEQDLKPSEVCKVMGISMYAYYNKKSRLLKKMKMMCENKDSDASSISRRKINA